MCLAPGSASAATDFLKGSVDEGVVKSHLVIPTRFGLVPTLLFVAVETFNIYTKPSALSFTYSLSHAHKIV